MGIDHLYRACRGCFNHRYGHLTFSVALIICSYTTAGG